MDFIVNRAYLPTAIHDTLMLPEPPLSIIYIRLNFVRSIVLADILTLEVQEVPPPKVTTTAGVAVPLISLGKATSIVCTVVVGVIVTFPDWMSIRSFMGVKAEFSE